MIRRFWSKIKNFFYWGWKLRANFDWDYMFLIYIIKFKIDRMIHYHENYGIVLTVEDEPDNPDADKYMMKSMRLCSYLCQRLIDRNAIAYAVHAEKAFNEKWGDVEIIEGKSSKGLTTVSFQRKNVNKNNEHIYRKESKKLADFSVNIYNRDKKLLFGIMEKYIEGWWE